MGFFQHAGRRVTAIPGWCLSQLSCPRTGLAPPSSLLRPDTSASRCGGSSARAQHLRAALTDLHRIRAGQRPARRGARGRRGGRRAMLVNSIQRSFDRGSARIGGGGGCKAILGDGEGLWGAGCQSASAGARGRSGQVPQEGAAGRVGQQLGGSGGGSGWSGRTVPALRWGLSRRLACFASAAVGDPSPGLRLPDWPGRQPALAPQLADPPAPPARQRRRTHPLHARRPGRAYCARLPLPLPDVSLLQSQGRRRGTDQACPSVGGRKGAVDAPWAPPGGKEEAPLPGPSVAPPVTPPPS